MWFNERKSTFNLIILKVIKSVCKLCILEENISIINFNVKKNNSRNYRYNYKIGRL